MNVDGISEQTGKLQNLTTAAHLMNPVHLSYLCRKERRGVRLKITTFGLQPRAVGYPNSAAKQPCEVTGEPWFYSAAKYHDRFEAKRP
jgi:hypothetical protein